MEALDSYRAKYGRDPKDANQLLNYSKKTADVSTLSFKEAREAMAGVASGASATSATAAPAAAPTATTTTDTGSGGSDEKTAEVGSSALFAELSQGLSVTSGLKKVDDSMKTKYRKDRSGKVAAGAVKKSTPVKKSGTVAKKKKDPSMKKMGLRWMIENYTEEAVHTVDTNEGSTKEEIFLASNSNCGFLINHKVKAVTIDGCEKIQVQIADVISSVEIINSKRVKVFLMGTVPSIVIDKCSEPRIIMSKHCLKAQPKFITAMSSDIIVEVEGETPDDDYKEVIIPYQFETYIDPVTRATETKPVEHG